MRVLFGLFLTIATISASWSQQKYWIFFTDKGQDLDVYDAMVSESYKDSILSQGFEFVSFSKWLNGIVVSSNHVPFELLNIDFVQSIQSVGRSAELAQFDNGEGDLDFVLAQMNGQALIEKGLSGKGVRVGVIDAGFSKINKISSTKYLFKNDQVKAFRDFIQPEKSVLNVPSYKDTVHSYLDAKFGNGTHGKSVLIKLAGKGDLTGEQFGFATGAEFYLARTENGKKEHRVEEYDWIRALEWMDSLGVQLVNSSLGYSEFDDKAENYTKDQMNGTVGVASKAAQIAVHEKGLFIVSSAGNSGNDKWRLITVPADAPDVLTVGATEKSMPLKIGYSSEGPEYNDYLKPDVAVHSPNGTSFSSPSVCGYVACLMEYAPHLSNLEILEIVRKSGALFPYGNNYVGYGVPNAKVALQLIDNWGIKNEEKPNPVKVIKSSKKKAKVVFTTKPLSNITLFRKKDKKNVHTQTYLNPYGELDDLKKQTIQYKAKKGKYILTVKKKSWEAQTTLQNGLEVVEIIWE